MKARAGKKPVVLELGGNAAAVLEDYRGTSELEKIIPKLIFGAYYQSGQSCISLQRLFVRHVSSSGYIADALRACVFHSDLTSSAQGFTATSQPGCEYLNSHEDVWDRQD